MLTAHSQAVYSGVHVYEMEVQNIACMRRRSDGWLNATQILKVAGVDKGKRTKVLEKEILVGEHEKVQGGYGKYQGTWISYKRGRQFCRQYGVEEILRPLLDYDVAADGSGGQGQDTPTKEQAMAANRKRFYNLDPGPNRGPSTNGTFFSNISPSTSVALAAMNKAARLNSPVPRPGTLQRQPSRHMSHQESFPGGSQQSMASQNSFDTESRFDSGYSTQPNGLREPPRKRKRLNSNEGMGPPSIPLDASIRSATPTEPNESFLYDTLSQEFANAGSDTAMPPLPPPDSDEQTEKLNLILDLFAGDGRTDYSTHPAILQLSGEDFNMPLDVSSNSALHWAATLANVSLLKLLLRRGANVWRGNAAGQSPLISAVIVNNCWEKSCFPEMLEVLSPLIEVRDIQGRTVLHHIAVSSGIKGRAPSSKYYLEALLEFLVRVGKQPNSSAAASTAVAASSMASQQAGGDETTGQESGDAPNVNGSKGAVSLVRFLSHIVNAKDKAGNTALNLVARIGNRSIIQQLLEIHADPGLANNKGVSAKDFGVGTESGESLLVNGLASQQSTQQAPASQPETSTETPSTLSQTEDLNQDVVSCMYTPLLGLLEHDANQIPAITSMLSQNLASHKDLLRQRTEQIDRLNDQIRELSTLHKTELERLQESQARIKTRGENQVKLANLRRILHDKRAALSPADREKSSGATELGSADSTLLPNNLAAVLPNIPKAGESISPDQRSLFSAALPAPSELRARLHAYETNNTQLRDHASELRGRSHDLEGLYRRVVSLCTGVDEDKVEGGQAVALEG
jgi:regulatory protein SWI6